MWLERLGWAAAIVSIGWLPTLWVVLKLITWRDRRRGLVDDDAAPTPVTPYRARGVDYRRF